MIKDHYILIYFGWVPPNNLLSDKRWSIIKENNTLKIINGKVIDKITEKDIINSLCWKDSDGRCVNKNNLPDFTTWEGYGWLVRACFRYNILIYTNGTVPIFTKDYFIQFRDILYDLLKEKENV